MPQLEIRPLPRHGPTGTPSRAGARGPVELAFLAGAVAVGAALRLHQIRDQILCDDEWHAIDAIVHQSPRWIATHFGFADFSIPITLYDWLVARWVGLSEMAVRAPVLVAGIGALVVLPLLVRPLVGARTSVVFAWLLAISPLHIYFSRFGRPYSIAFLAAAVGALAFLRWVDTTRLRWGLLWAACAVVGPWFHPLMLPFLAAPGAWALVQAWRGHRLPPRFFVVSAAAVLGLALLLGPPLVIDRASIAERASAGRLHLATLRSAFELFSGAQLTLSSFCAGIALLFGSIHLARAAPRPWLFLLVLCAAQLAAIALVRPAELHFGIVLARYMLPALLVFLLAVAAGLAELDRGLHAEWRWIPPHAASLALVASLLAFGPLLSLHDRSNRTYFTPNAWTNHSLYQYQYSADARQAWARGAFLPREAPQIYRDIASEAGPDDAVLEAPWSHFGYSGIYSYYQKLHQRRMLIGFVTPPGEELRPGEVRPWDPRFRFRFRNFAHAADIERLRRTDVRFVVFHRDLGAETTRMGPLRYPEVERWIARYRNLVGPPWRDDGRICVFDLRR